MLHFILEMLLDKNGKVSIGRFGFLLTVATTIFWTNAIFAMYFWNALQSKATPDMPSQLVMIIVTLLGGYIGAKVPEALSGLGSGLKTPTQITTDTDLPGNITGLAVKDDGTPKQEPCRPGCLICKKKDGH